MLTAAKHSPHRVSQEVTALLVDNGSSKCRTHIKSDFIQPLQSYDYIVEGYSSGTKVTQVGTVRWRMEDDDRVIHSFEIPSTLYCLTSKARLLSPQHWAQERSKKMGPYGNVKVVSDAQGLTLIWNEGKNQKNIPFSKSNNVATWTSRP